MKANEKFYHVNANLLHQLKAFCAVILVNWPKREDTCANNILLIKYVCIYVLNNNSVSVNTKKENKSTCDLDLPLPGHFSRFSPFTSVCQHSDSRETVGQKSIQTTCSRGWTDKEVQRLPVKDERGWTDRFRLGRRGLTGWFWLGRREKLKGLVMGERT